MTALVVAMDGGQSSTMCLAADLEGRILGLARSGPIWHLGEPGGPERVRSAVADSLAGALRQAGRSGDDVVQAYLSLTGATGFASEVARELLPQATITATSDALGGLASGTYGEPGVAVVAGTGSVAVAVDEQGATRVGGGWGPTLGDQGSAYGIGLAALRAVAQAADRTGPATVLSTAALEQLGVEAPRALFNLVYTRELDRVGIAALAPLVLRLASGDAVAASIVDEAADALIRLAVSTADGVDLLDEHKRVVLTGGLLQGNPGFADRVRAGVRSHLPSYAIVRPAVRPIVGALALALRACGLDATAILTARLATPEWPPDLLAPHPTASKGHHHD